MSDLETKLAEAGDNLSINLAVKIAREVVAEKDQQLLDMFAYTAEFNAYREQLAQMTKEIAEKDAEIARLKGE